MAEQRQFRFRLPWLSASATPPRVTTPPRPVPEPEAPRPTPVEIRAPPQPTASISTQRSPFRPAGIAPPPPAAAPQAQRSLSPRQTTTETRPASPVRTQHQGSSVPPSPSPSAAAESKVASLPSPSKKPQLSISVEEPKPAEHQSREEMIAPKTQNWGAEPQQKATSEVKKPEPAAHIKSPARFSPFSRASEERKQNIRTEGESDAPSSEDNSLRNRVAAFLSSNANATQARDPVKQGQEEKEETGERKKPVTEKVEGVSSSQSRVRKSATTANGGEQVPLHKEIKEDISKLVQKLGMGNMKHPMGGEQRPVSIVTLAGENMGATILLGGDPERKGGSLHIHRGYKTNPDDRIESTTDGEGVNERASPMAYINSNTQSINNSILLDSMVNERDPGVHFSLSRSNQPELNRSAIDEEAQTRRAEFNPTPSEKLTYEPRLRRRCLRGLFMETSDSEPDNPDKPRRHGCRAYGFGQTSKH
ncbi:unnamed protein product [Linum trigynum]|uniref:Uncharacterized protein n=1 Tax=Linum trigynum TaxID=586398 RepID=A0AAV2CHS6_9ROSI